MARFAVVVVPMMLLSMATPPAAALPYSTGWPSLAALLSRLAPSAAWAYPQVATPVQQSGTAAGLPRSAPASATHAGGGNGRQRGTGAGELPPYQAHTATRQTANGPAVGDGSHSFNPATSRRLADRATNDSDLYQNTDGTYTRVLSPTPVNYRASDGTWQPINVDLHVGADGRLRTGGNAASLTFAASAATADLVSLRLDAAHEFGYGLSGAAATTLTSAADTATYAHVLPDTDLRLQARADGLKESLVLHTANRPELVDVPDAPDRSDRQAGRRGHDRVRRRLRDRTGPQSPRIHA